VGFGILVAMMEFGILRISYTLILIILISILTLPHSIVMHNFYRHDGLRTTS